jgi:nitroreductase
METWDAILSRRNVREFADRPIGDEDLDRILEAGRRAPSSRNWQPWDYVVVTDRAQLAELAQVWRGGAHIAGSAATVVIVLAQYEDAGQLQRAAFDAGQASVQMMIAAADLGIGSGHSAVGDQARAREILGFPEDHLAYIMIDFGYPAGRPLAPIRRPDRKPFDEVVHRGRW